MFLNILDDKKLGFTITRSSVSAFENFEKQERADRDDVELLGNRTRMAGSRHKLFHSQRFMGAVLLAVVLWIAGSVQLLAQPTTQDEAKDTLAKLQIRDVPEPNIQMPEIYTREPEIIEQVVSGTPEWKLFYFCKYQPSSDLKKIIDEQFADRVVDPKGKESVTLKYNVSSNSATNQLIVKCPSQEDAQSVLDALYQIDVPPIQVKIDCLISDIYADFTYDRETTIAIENLFGENIALKPGGTPFGADVQKLVEDAEYLPAFPGASLRELIRARMGLKIGYSSSDHEFTALVDMLESRGYLKILMNPTLEIVNGKTARVQSRQHVPLQKITKTVPGAGTTTVVLTETEYVDVVDSLEITPHVFADGYIGLETNILLGSKNTPDGVKQVPILTEKQIQSKENRIRPGESLIIGGIRKNEKFGVARGVPILKDIPLIGFLFSGEDMEQRAIETVFILTPTISTGGRPRKDVMAEIYRQHETKPTDPFGSVARHQEENEKAAEIEQDRLEAQAEQRNAQITIEQAQQRVAEAQEELRRLKAEAEKIKADIKGVQVEADKEGNSEQDNEVEQADKGKSGAQAQANEIKNDDVIEKAQPEMRAKLQTDRLAVSCPQWLGSTLR